MKIVRFTAYAEIETEDGHVERVRQDGPAAYAHNPGRVASLFFQNAHKVALAQTRQHVDRVREAVAP